MAGDWLKLEVGTPDKPEVLAITAMMGWDDPDLTVGKLFRVWRWFDQHTTDGNAAGVTPALLDRIAGVSGFASAMEKAGWLLIFAEGLLLPNFSRHNGKSAKNRALTAARVAIHKASAAGNAHIVTGALPREEKRREVNTSANAEGFDAFWAAYPKRRNKGDAEKAWAKLKPSSDLLKTILEAVEVAKRGDDWRKDGGQYVPYPASWLNAKGWEDDRAPAASTADDSLFRGVL